MKRTFALILLLLSVTALKAGDIGSAKDLEAFIKAYNECGDLSPWMSADSTFRFSADIDLSKVKKLPQIKAFAGVLDGCGHSIKGWKAQGGLIAEILPEAKVSGIVIDKSCSMKVTSKAGTFSAGFIADLNNGIVSDCDNYGTVQHKCSYAQSHLYIGGIVGINRFCVLRCRNFGRVESESAGGDSASTKEIVCAVGGVVGGCPGKILAGATIVWCSNEGEVVQYGDFAIDAVGGLVGICGGATIKLCTNKGTVSSVASLNSINSSAGVAKVGGIVGQTKSDIMCCDNFGTVSSSGVATSNIGGIVGMPHAALVIGDCVNYGKVHSSNEGPCFTGGIAGVVGRPVHFRRCTNAGEVIFDGVSPRERSATGGILGQSYVTKRYDTATYIRCCTNTGKVRSESGGNNYGNSDNAIHTGGIAGFMNTREDVLSYVYECANSGNVTSATGRRSNMCACANNVTTGGSYNDDCALSVEPLPGGVNVYGRVLASDGKPIAGVVVTDGRQCVETAADGSYEMKSDLDEARFVYISIPAAYQVPVYRSLPQFFRRIGRGEKAVCANFTLEPRTTVSDEYTLLMVGDPQVRPLKYGDNSMETWGGDVAPDIEAYRASCKGDVYSINLGDLVYNYMYAYDDYLDKAAQINCPVFNVIGNHDYDQQTLFDGHLGQLYFETYVGPEHYSFTIGGIHFVVVNTILYDRKKAGTKYRYGLDDRTMAWLENDLRSVPKDMTIMTCAHANMFKNPNSSPNGSHGVYFQHYEDYRALISSFKHVYSWSGHYHQNYYYNYEGKRTRHGAPNIESVSVSRCTGALRFNRPIASDGTPQGYMVATVKGGKMEWVYKSVGHDLSYQIKIYAPGRCGDKLVRALVWNHSEGWSAPEWWENGVKVADMEYVGGTDPDYKDLWDAFTNKRDRKYCKPSEKSNIFAVTPTEGSRGGEVRVRDQFGNEYKQVIEW